MRVTAWFGTATLAVAGAALPATAQAPRPDFGPNLERFTYPWPVERMPVTIAGEAGTMAFMDLRPHRPNGRSVILLHGKNFCGATWESTARGLVDAGFRVLVPDQVGFCKSAKPRGAQYSFALLASLTRKLAQTRGITSAAVIGHSMGGMLAMRYAIAYPEAVERLVLVNPLGLRDRSADGVPYVSVDTLLADERKRTYASIKAYQLENYYHGQWRAPYDRWVWMLAGMYAGAGRETVALAQAKTSEMIATQPVAHDLHRIKAPSTLIIGTLDRTAFGRQHLPPDLRSFLRTIPEVAPEAVRKIPGARLVRLDGVGHSPQIEAPGRLERALLAALN